MPRAVSAVVLSLALSLLASSPFAQGSPGGSAAFVNGQWFDGTTFHRGTFYVVDGKLRGERPRGEVRTVDLAGGFVVPAFGDAHNHFPGAADNLPWATTAFRDVGIFYVLNPNDIAELSQPIRAELGSASSIDVAFAHAGFTRAGGHPKGLYERLVKQKVYAYSNEQLADRAYYAIDSMADLDRAWPLFVATKPDLVKIYLLFSELAGVAPSTLTSRGLRPELAAEVARRAKAAGLRSSAHVETAADFRAALDAGVDLILHLPGYSRSTLPLEAYALTVADAERAAYQRTAVAATLQVSARTLGEDWRRVQVSNLERLRDAGVNVLIGSDGAPFSARAEAEYLKETGVFTNRALLNMWSRDTPKAIFPARRIGELQPGYEASFLVLRRNPLDDFSAVREIAMSVKRGVVRPPG